MSCECHRIGGPWVAEDPDCPRHGLAAQARARELDAVRDQVSKVSTLEEARELIHKILDLME